MKTMDKTLVRKLAVVLVLKVMVLTALWWFFVRDQHVTVDADSVAAQFLKQSPLPAQGASQ